MTNHQALILLILSFLSSIAHAENEFKIIALQHRLAQEILPIIEPLVGASGSISGINNQIIIRTENKNMREIEQTIATLDRERKNWRILVSRDAETQDTHSAITAEGNITIGEVAISNSPRRTIRNSADVMLSDTQQQSIQRSTQFVAVMDGQSAFIRVGELIPYTQDWILLTQRYAYAYQTAQFVEITTGFAVQVTSTGSTVVLKITPRIAKIGNSTRIDFEELSTTVQIKPGEWFDLGNTMQSHDEVSQKILGHASRTGQNNSELRIKIE